MKKIFHYYLSLNLVFYFSLNALFVLSPSVSLAVTPTPTPYVIPSPKPGIKGNASEDKSSKTIGMVAAAAGGGYCAYQATQTCPSCYSTEASCWACYAWLAGIGASVAIGVSLSKSKKQAQNTYDAVDVNSPGNGNIEGGPDGGGGGGGDGTGNPTGNNTGPNPYSDPGRPSDIPGVKELEKIGVKINPDGSFVTPDGKFLKPSDFSSPSAMAKAGMNPNDWGKTNEILKEAGKEAQKAALKAGVDSEEGSSSAYAQRQSAGSSALQAQQRRGYRGPSNAQNAGRQAANVSGMSVNHNGDAIGVAGDSLFDMTNNRYNLQYEQGRVMISP